VSALRIVEREESIDKEVRRGLWKRDTSRRPKQYRKKVMRLALCFLHQALLHDATCLLSSVKRAMLQYRCWLLNVLVIAGAGHSDGGD
jgi:hypothetical protein